MPDSTTNDDRYMITRVKALYPRINQTYKFDSSAGKKGQSVPCDALDDGAKYELSFLLDESAAKELYAPMAKAYLASPKRDNTWHETLPLPFKKEVDEDLPSLTANETNFPQTFDLLQGAPSTLRLKLFLMP